MTTPFVEFKMNLKTLTRLSGLLFLLIQPCLAENIELKTVSGNVATAYLLTGDNDSNPVLILHGFLQTNEFSTVQRLSTALNDSGYTVLAPTLTLGINNRKQSLSCEAIHTHSLDTDVSELKQWIDWLHTKTRKPVTLIAHSAGGTAMLKYMADHGVSNLDKTVLISLSYYASGPEANETPEHEAKALAALKSGKSQIADYALNYCKSYPSYPQAFLSYYNWSKSKTEATVKKFNEHITIIVGTDDKRIDSDWKFQLQKIPANMVLIEGANHFFDQAHEFDLTDNIENILQQ